MKQNRFTRGQRIDFASRMIEQGKRWSQPLPSLNLRNRIDRARLARALGASPVPSKAERLDTLRALLGSPR